MSEHSKNYNNPDEFRKACNALNEYQKSHNIIRKDYQELLHSLMDNFFRNK